VGEKSAFHSGFAGVCFSTMYKRFDTDLLQEAWDAVFIGSGPGCLTAAAVLAKAGWRVLVLERHYEPGGFTHTFKRKGYEWDVGVHYIGNVHRPQSVERRLFDYITDGRLEWADMGSPYDRALVDGGVYDFVPGWPEQVALWQSYFPAESEAIQRYADLIRDCAGASRSFFVEKAVPPIVAGLAGPFMTRKFRQFSDRTTYEVLRELTANETLITVLCAQLGDYGLPPNKSSFAIHAMVVNHYRNGGAYPVGGAPSIHQGIIATIEAHGGAVVLRAPVDRVEVDGRRATGVRLESGETVRARHVVSGAGVRNTYTRLLDDAHVPAAVSRALEAVAPSLAHMCLYLGLRTTDRDLELPKFNYWVYDPYRGDETPGGRVTTAYISFPSAKDPAWRESHPGKATVQCIGPCPYETVAQWEGSRWKHRGGEYDAVKAAFQERMLGILLDLHPNIEGHIEWSEVSTPLSTVHFSNHPRGEIYGLEHTPRRFQEKWLRPRTPIKNFWLTGQDIVTVGIGGALMSGMVTTSAMLGKNLVKDVLTAQRA